MKTLLIALSCAAAMTAVPFAARAQFGNPGFMTPDSAKPAPAASVPNASDRLFVLLVGGGGLAEVELARLAEGKSRSRPVRDFALRMQQDHGRANQQLLAAAREAALPAPDAPGDDQRRQLEALRQRADGADFEAAYLRQQLVEHQKTVQLLAWEIDAGQTPPLQHFAAQTLPVVLEHIAHLRALLEPDEVAPPRR